jgi:hypothetical protein
MLVGMSNFGISGHWSDALQKLSFSVMHRMTATFDISIFFAWLLLPQRLECKMRGYPTDPSGFDDWIHLI